MKNRLLLISMVLIPFTALASTYYELHERLEEIKDKAESSDMYELEYEMDMALYDLESLNDN